jgi:predicted enzyme related to lactoylglutathione lyase
MATAELRAKLVFCNVPTVNSDAALRFYGTLLGSEDFVPAPNRPDSYFRPISPDGIDLTINRRYEDTESWTCYFAVDSLDRAIEELRGIGGEVVSEPSSVPSAGGNGEIGRFAVMLDPDRNHVGLIELRDEAAQQYFGLRERQPLRPEQREALSRGGRAQSA